MRRGSGRAAKMADRDPPYGTDPGYALIYANTIVQRGTPWIENAAWSLMVPTSLHVSFHDLVYLETILFPKQCDQVVPADNPLLL
jgi:hypothetical protein